ncbi:MAG: DUF3656 domain-containing protein [Bacilli bacterium]
MKIPELLAPVGNFKNLKAAVMGGCDAVYLGGNLYGARGFAANFSNDEIIKAINYCHLYGVKVYVTVNTLIYEHEVTSFIKYIAFLHQNNVDAVIIQDLGMLDLVRKTFPNLVIHASTQMHVHNLDGVLFMKKLGVKRVVLARELSLDLVKKIKKNVDIELEIFVHGSLCVSYSGQCLMSSLIGNRSGNRGTCTGSCRLNYDVMSGDYKFQNNKYPLSCKDLCTLENIICLIESGVDSFKIEGRMKSAVYVYKVASLYRYAIDNYVKNKKNDIKESSIIELKKIFNREFTKGFLFDTSNDDIVNSFRPNHRGVDVGEVLSFKDGMVKVKLVNNISINSGIRIISDVDYGFILNEFYVNNKLVKKAFRGDIITFKFYRPIYKGARVIITRDNDQYCKLEKNIALNLRRVKITGKVIGFLDERLTIILDDGKNVVNVVGNRVIRAKNRPTTKAIIFEKIIKLGDTIYEFTDLIIDISDNIFIPLNELNNLRREVVSKLNLARLYKLSYVENIYDIVVPDFKQERLRAVLVNADLYQQLSKNLYDIIYCDISLKNTILKLPRVMDNYCFMSDLVLVGDVGAFNKLDKVITDFSFNVTNSYTVAFLHSVGARRVTLSYELRDDQIKNLIKAYHDRYKKHPNLELIVSGYEEVMVCKFSLNKKYNRDLLHLRDRFGNLYKVVTVNDIMYIYNYRARNNYDVKYYDMGINCLRDNK